MPDSIPDLMKDLADSISTAVDVQNRYWFTLAFASVFVLIPQVKVDDEGVKTVTMPFDLPPVDAKWWVPISVLLLSVLVVAFASAQAHLVHTQQLARKIVDEKCGEVVIEGQDRRDIMEALRKPSLTRVSSISQVVLGKHQFLSEEGECSPWRRHASASLYAFLKSLVVAVWIVLPGIALLLALGRFVELTDLPAWIQLVWIAAVAAFVSLLISAGLEVAYLFSTIKRYWGSRR